MGEISTSMSLLITDIVCLVFLGALAATVYKGSVVTKKNQAIFIIPVVLIIVLGFADVFAILSAAGRSDMRTLDFIWNSLIMVLVVSIPTFLQFAFDQEWKLQRRLAYLLLGFNAMMAILSPFTGFYYSIGATGEFTRGPFYWVYGVCIAISILYMIFVVAHLSRQYQERSRSLLAFPVLFMAASCLIRYLFPTLHSDWGLIAAAITLTYICLRERLVSHDEATGLLNRRAYESDIESISKKTGAYVILLDIDNYKETTITYGQAYGEKCVTILADVVNRIFGPIGFCYRTGTDTFCVFCRTYDEKLIKKKSDEFLQAIIQQRQTTPYLPMISTGFAVYIKGDKSLEATIQKANEQMQYYKQLRREGKPIVKREEDQ